MSKKKSQKKQRGKSRPAFYLVMFLIPLVFISLLELVLRLNNYGNNIDSWIITNGHYTANPNLALRYFNNIETIPATIEDAFDINRKENTYRIFVLGGSSAAGFPYMPLGSFSRYLSQRLKQNYPNKNIEVINLGIAAVNSYTILDLLPDVIVEKPDVILIYAGHNEYYGALGVGSLESFGRSRLIIKTILFLNHFKTFQLLKNLLGIFNSVDNSRRPGTLMAKMAEEKIIPYKSDLYSEGIEQFRQNIKEIIEICKDKNIPIILGTITSNQKDLPPFSEYDSEEYGTAGKAYSDAQLALSEGNFQKADSLFKLSKDLDALRFRAPSEINDVLISLSNNYKIPVANIDSAFRANCDYNIVGNELMTDHLHPTLEGYQLMGKLFYESMYKNNFLPAEDAYYPYEIQDSVTLKNYLISELDLKIAQYTIEKIKNDFPFVGQTNKKTPQKNLNSLNRESQIAYLAANNKMKWAEAHIVMAREAENRNDIQTMLEHMDLLIAQYPYTKEIYDITINILLKSENYNLAFPYLMKRYQLGKDLFLSKWIASIYFQNDNHDKSIKYFKESLVIDPRDTQSLYNLGVIYSLNGNPEASRKYLNDCLSIDPNHTEAKILLEKLE